MEEDDYPQTNQKAKRFKKKKNENLFIVLKIVKLSLLGLFLLHISLTLYPSNYHLSISNKFPIDSVAYNHRYHQTQSSVLLFEVRKNWGCADVYFYRTGKIHIWKINWLMKIVFWYLCISVTLRVQRWQGGKWGGGNASFESWGIILQSSLPNICIFCEIQILLRVSLLNHFWIWDSKFFFFFFPKLPLRQSARFQWKPFALNEE